MPRITLTDIAKKTGLSKFAVSRALSGKSGVSEDTRKHVRAVAMEMGYLRTPVANAKQCLGVVFHDTDLVNSELQMLAQSGFQAECTRLGYQTRMIWAHEPEAILHFARDCVGVALFGPHSKQSRYRLKETGVPLALNGWLGPLEAFDLVNGTDHEGGAAVANYLIEHGHKHITYVQGSSHYRGRWERFYGLREVAERHADVAVKVLAFDTEDQFKALLIDALNQADRPTAFFCAHDGLALTVMSELMRMGFDIPNDITVVGFGDFSAATQIKPNLTTVKVHGFEIGVALAKVLDDRLKERINPLIPVRLTVVGRLIIRSSSGSAFGSVL